MEGAELLRGKEGGWSIGELISNQNWLFLNICQEIHVDTKNKVVTTPAFMCETKVHEIHDGIGKMVQAVLSLVK